ncbi:MAG: GNAT family N-acetyltransferase [Bacteroidota bacterium]
MANNFTDIKLHNNTSRKRFEMDVNGSTAFIEYNLENGVLTLVHTEVPEVLRGEGAGSAIILKTLVYARENNLTIKPVCPFVVAYIQRHPEWLEFTK